MSPFTLGRMRHLDLLALWCELHPDGHDGTARMLALAPAGYLAAAILGPA